MREFQVLRKIYGEFFFSFLVNGRSFSNTSYHTMQAAAYCNQIKAGFDV